MATGFVLGLDGKAYYNTGTNASPTWVLVENIKDLTQNLERGEFDVTTRGGGGFVQRVPVLADGSIDFQMVYDPDDADVTQVQTDFFAKTVRQWAFMDGPIATVGSQGLRAGMGVFNFSRSENLTEAMMVDVSLKVSRFVESSSEVTPDWYEVT